jgi:hypothetical protein
VQELGFSLAIQGALIYKLRGPWQTKGPTKSRPPNIPSKGTEIMGKYRREKKNLINSKKKSCAKEIFESIIGCKHPLIASGATTMGALVAHPTKLTQE